MSESIPREALPVGARIKLDTDRFWWTVRAHAGEQYVICTRQATFRPAGENVYTILDGHKGIRGPLNIVGWGHPCSTGEDISEIVSKLEGTGDWADDEPWGISHRNNVRLRIVAVKA